MRVAPFNVAAALLIIGAGLAGGRAAYGLWAAALAVQWVSPLLFPVRGRFAIRPDHFTERHGALVIIVFGESVADIGIGIGTARHAVTISLVVSATLGLALAATLWWTYFGVGDDERAEQAMTQAIRKPGPGWRWPPTSTPTSRYCSASSPWPPGSSRRSGTPERPCRTRRAWPWPRRRPVPGRRRGVPAHAADRPAALPVTAAVAALAVSAVGSTVSVAVEIALLALIVAAALAAEHRGPRRGSLPRGVRGYGSPG